MCCSLWLAVLTSHQMCGWLCCLDVWPDDRGMEGKVGWWGEVVYPPSLVMSIVQTHSCRYMNMPLHTWPQNPFPHNTSPKWPNCLSEVFILRLLLLFFQTHLFSSSIAPNSPFPLPLYNCSFTVFPTQPLLPSLYPSPSSFLPLFCRHLAGFTEFVVQGASSVVSDRRNQSRVSVCLRVCMYVQPAYPCWLTVVLDHWHQNSDHPDIKMC